jgi:myb proto-oncogene protein
MDTRRRHKLKEAVKKHGKDWVAVAKLVPGRTNLHCRQRWVYTVGPTGNDGNKIKWTPEEDAKLRKAVKKHRHDWVAVAKLVPVRTSRQCRERWVNILDPGSGKNSGKWAPAEDAKLVYAVKKHGKDDWVTVAAMVPGRTNVQCCTHFRTLDSGNHGKKSGKWTPDEDAKLKEAVKKHDNDWVAVFAMVPSRTGKQCRERWVCTMGPTGTNGNKIKWTPKEDAKLAEAVNTHDKDWAAVAKLVSGRMDKQCRD